MSENQNQAPPPAQPSQPATPAPPPAVTEQQIKGWFLSPTIWFLLAVGASFSTF